MKNTFTNNRILILGSPGSGKSTFAKKLAESTGLPLIHLDNIWWKADRTHISREEFDLRLAEVLQGEKWIIDGDYSRTWEPRIAACDTAVFLDLSEEECMAGITERVGQARTDIPWTEQELDPELAELFRSYRETKRPALMELLDRYPEKLVIIFTARAAADAWLAGKQAGAPC